MKRTTLILAVCAAVGALHAQADEAAVTEKLIALDKTWGEAQDATTLEGLLDPEIMSIAPDGLANRSQMIADTTGADAPQEPYQPGDYKVQLLDDDTAVMVHTTAGEEPHYSMHVWRKKDGEWKVVATASTPLD
jgi:hypothetical protein